MNVWRCLYSTLTSWLIGSIYNMGILKTLIHYLLVLLLINPMPFWSLFFCIRPRLSFSLFLISGKFSCIISLIFSPIHILGSLYNAFYSDVNSWIDPLSYLSSFVFHFGVILFSFLGNFSSLTLKYLYCILLLLLLHFKLPSTLSVLWTCLLIAFCFGFMTTISYLILSLYNFFYAPYIVYVISDLFIFPDLFCMFWSSVVHI